MRKKPKHPFDLRKVSYHSQYQGGMALLMRTNKGYFPANGPLASFLVQRFAPIGVDKKALVFRD